MSIIKPDPFCFASFKTTASDYADNISTKEIEFKKKDDDED